MQANLRLVVWTLVGVAALWFVIMTANRNLFLHSDVDRTFYGTIAISQTDIGDQCGADYRNSFEPVEYKMNAQGQIVYLCPQGIWPIQRTVVAATIPNNFRKILSPTLIKKLDVVYAPPAAVTNTMGSPAAQQQAAPPPAIANPFSPAEEQGTATPPPAAQEQEQPAAPQQQEQPAAPQQQAQPIVTPQQQPMVQPRVHPASPSQPLNQPANPSDTQSAQPNQSAGPNPFIQPAPGTQAAPQAAPTTGSAGSSAQ